MRCVCVGSLAFVNFNKSVKENTTVKSSKKMKPAKPSQPVTKDILGDARKILQEMSEFWKGLCVPT